MKNDVCITIGRTGAGEFRCLFQYPFIWMIAFFSDPVLATIEWVTIEQWFPNTMLDDLLI